MATIGQTEARGITTVTPKAYWRGTHRAVAPAETLARFARHAATLGLTRLANVTGLDYLGLPVFMAVRPNGRSLSVAQGKGLTEESARTSAFMEAAEFAHAEDVALRPRLASYSALKANGRVADPDRLPRQKGCFFRHDREMAWLAGIDLRSGESIWVPHDLVHLDFTCPPKHAASGFLTSSNGLASGNEPLEALCTALCELIERDALSLWRFRTAQERGKRRLVLSTVTDPDCRDLLERLEKRGMSVSVWDITTDIGVASFLCRIREAPGNARSHLGAFWGSGTHLSRGVALSRSLTEAAQSRLTYIAGSRDDLRQMDYEEAGGQTLLEIALDHEERRTKGQDFGNVPDFCAASFEEDRERLVSLLDCAGSAQIILVDLTRAAVGIPVLRVIVPGLEGASDDGLCRPGYRARALKAGSQ